MLLEDIKALVAQMEVSVTQVQYAVRPVTLDSPYVSPPLGITIPGCSNDVEIVRVIHSLVEIRQSQLVDRLRHSVQISESLKLV